MDAQPGGIDRVHADVRPVRRRYYIPESRQDGVGNRDAFGEEHHALTPWRMAEPRHDPEQRVSGRVALPVTFEHLPVLSTRVSDRTTKREKPRIDGPSARLRARDPRLGRMSAP